MNEYSSLLVIRHFSKISSGFFFSMNRLQSGPKVLDHSGVFIFRDARFLFLMFIHILKQGGILFLDKEFGITIPSHYGQNFILAL